MLRCLPLIVFSLLSMAFAPAPVYKPERDRSNIDLTRFQGTWKVIGHHNWAQGRKQTSPWSFTHIRVQKDRWTVMETTKEVVTYRIELHAEKKPCHIDWRGSKGEALWLGLIRRDRDTVEVIYLTANQRPENFDTPASGSKLITLQRDPP